METLPNSVSEYLSASSVEGERNRRLFNAACQLRDSGWAESDAMGVVGRKAVDDGLSQQEVTTTLRSVFRRESREEPKNQSRSSTPFRDRKRNFKIKMGSSAPPKLPLTEVPKQEATTGYSDYYRENFSEHDTPPDYKVHDGEGVIPEGGIGAEEFIDAMFEPGLAFCLHKAELGVDGKEHPAASAAVSRVFPYERWKEISKRKGGADRIYENNAGCYISLNPLKGGKRRLENIYDYKHFLLEFDDIPKEHQYRVILRSKIPCTAILDTGGKSIHAVVLIQAAGESEWRSRATFILNHFRKYGPDTSNNDPTRMTRLPGYRRSDTKNYQRCLHLRTGARSYEEWEKEAVELTETEMNIEKMMDFKPEEDPDILLGNRWLNRGSAAILSGQSGIGKSSFIMQMTCTWALGRPFFGVKPTGPMRILLIQAENDYGDMAEMLQGTTSGMGLSTAEIKKISKGVVLKEQAKLSGEEFVGYLAWLIDMNKPDLVIVDPLLHYFGGDLANQQDASHFLRKLIHPLVKTRKICLLFVHHTVKPPRDKGDWGRFDAAYASFGSSELVNWPREVMTLGRINDDGEFLLAFAKRGKRAGMLDSHGTHTDAIILKHATDRIYWERSETTVEDLWAKPKKESKAKPKTAEEKVDYFDTGGEPDDLMEVIKGLLRRLKWTKSGYSRKQALTYGRQALKLSAKDKPMLSESLNFALVTGLLVSDEEAGKIYLTDDGWKFRRGEEIDLSPVTKLEGEDMDLIPDSSVSNSVTMDDDHPF